MKDQWAAKHVLDMDIQWKVAMKRKQCLQSAAANDTTKISAPAQKSDAATAEMTTKHSQETAQIFKRETEIVQIQTIERIPREQAILKLLRINPHPELIFSNAVKNTSSQITSKSPTRTNQESQSESSEDDSPPVLSYGHGYYTEGKGKRKGARTPQR